MTRKIKRDRDRDKERQIVSNIVAENIAWYRDIKPLCMIHEILSKTILGWDRERQRKTERNRKIGKDILRDRERQRETEKDRERQR